MRYDRDRHHRRSTRLKGYDYASAGGYFVTICVHGREPVLGQVAAGEMALSDWGCVVDKFWAQVPIHFPNVSIDMQVTMPNHVHAIILIHESKAGTGALGGATPPLQNVTRSAVAAPPSTIARPTLGQIVAYYKFKTTKQIQQVRGAPGGRFWQRNFHDTIIRNRRQLDALREYIRDNPEQWALDAENPDRYGRETTGAGTAPLQSSDKGIQDR